MHVATKMNSTRFGWMRYKASHGNRGDLLVKRCKTQNDTKVHNNAARKDNCTPSIN